MKLNLKSTIAAPAGNGCQKALNGIIGNTRRGIVVDKTLDPDSNNPVANKAVSTALAALAGQLAKGQVVFLDQLPESGESQKVYVLTATNQRYWWNGNAFVKIVPTDIKDSTTIKHTLAENKISLDLDETIKEKIDAALQKPTGLTKTKLVGVGTNGQENIEIGDNLTLANGKLSATVGGAEEFNELIINNYLSMDDILEIANFLFDSSDKKGINIITKEFSETVSFSNDKPIKVIIDLGNSHIVYYAYKTITGYGIFYFMSNAWAYNSKVLIIGYLVGSSTSSTQIDSIKFYVIGDTSIFSHFITITKNTSTFYFNYQNTSEDKLNTLDSLKTALAGKFLLCTGHTDSETAEYISGEGANIVVGVVDNSDHSTSDITIDSSYTISDDVSPVE